MNLPPKFNSTYALAIEQTDLLFCSFERKTELDKLFKQGFIIYDLIYSCVYLGFSIWLYLNLFYWFGLLIHLILRVIFSFIFHFVSRISKTNPKIIKLIKTNSFNADLLDCWYYYVETRK